MDPITQPHAAPVTYEPTLARTDPGRRNPLATKTGSQVVEFAAERGRRRAGSHYQRLSPQTDGSGPEPFPSTPSGATKYPPKPNAIKKARHAPAGPPKSRMNQPPASLNSVVQQQYEKVDQPHLSFAEEARRMHLLGARAKRIR